MLRLNRRDRPLHRRQELHITPDMHSMQAPVPGILNSLGLINSSCIVPHWKFWQGSAWEEPQGTVSVVSRHVDLPTCELPRWRHHHHRRRHLQLHGHRSKRARQLKDLLFYLSDTCRHSDIGYTRNEQGTLVIPRLLPSTSWHCTRQDDWTFQQSHWALPHV